MKQKIYKTIFSLLLLFSEAIIATENYKVGVLTVRSIDHTINRWQPTLDYLTSKLPDYSFQLIPLSFGKVEDAVRKQRIDFLLTSSGQFSSLKKNYSLSPIATLRDRFKDNVTGQYGAVIITRSDRKDIHSLEDLKGKRFAAVHKKSFSGFLMAYDELKQAGIDPYSDFSVLNFMSFPYDDVVLAIQHNIVDAGTVRTGILEKMADKGRINIDDFKVLSQKQTNEFPLLLSTKLYPEWPFTALAHISSNTSAQVAAALSEMPAEHANSILSNHAGWSTNIDYEPVHNALEKLDSSLHGKEIIAVTLFILIVTSVVALILTLYLVLTRVSASSMTKTIVPASFFFLLLFSGVAVVVANSFIRQHNENIQDNAGALGKSLARAFTQEINEKFFLNKLIISNYKFEIMAGNGDLFPDELQDMAISSKALSLDYQFLAIADENGQLLSVQGSRQPGEQCKAAIAEFAKNAEGVYPDITVHGENGYFHFDSMSHVDGKNSPILFQSYDLNTLIKHFSPFENKYFEAIVVTQDNLNKIAFSAEGVGYSLEFGETLNQKILDLALFETNISKTNWRLLVLPVEKQITAYAVEIYSYALALVVLSIILFVVFLKRLKKEENVRIELLQTTNTDELTGLPNRRYFEEYANMALLQSQRNNEKLAILFIDLDGFKVINDTISHDAGDKALQYIADTFRQVIRKNEFIARIGGDEFCLVVTNFNQLDELRITAARLIETCSGSFKINNVVVKIGLSIGIATYPKDGTSLQALLSQADETMYKVKKHYKGGYAMSGDMSV